MKAQLVASPFETRAAGALLRVRVSLRFRLRSSSFGGQVARNDEC